MINGQDAALAKKESGADFADVFHEKTYSSSILLEDGHVDKLSGGLICGTGIRTIKGRQTDYRFFAKPYESRSGSQKEDSLSTKIALLEKADSVVRKISPLIKQVSVSYGDVVQDIEISNSDGLSSAGTRKRARFVINVIAADNGVIQTGFETAGGAFGFEELIKSDLEALSALAAERAVKMLSARHAPSGKMPVVIMSEAGGTLIHEACGHGLEADFIEKGISIYKKIGDKVASELITVIDDATVPGLYGSFEFDDEGTPSKKKILIENGVLKGFMSDIYYSKLLGITPSGNGRRESFAEKPQPRMTNTYIAKGSSDPAEIIASIKTGILVKKLGGGQVNVTNGDFVFDIQESYQIVDGKIKEPLRGATLIGNGPEVLKNIDMVGTDLHFITGTCGKGDHAPVTDAMPTVRIKEIVVGGRQ
ncbi:MAG: TldD/PmbA family protein [Candidatus Margulisiibacteriota bacterium]